MRGSFNGTVSVSFPVCDSLPATSLLFSEGITFEQATRTPTVTNPRSAIERMFFSELLICEASPGRLKVAVLNHYKIQQLCRIPCGKALPYR
jgi:hypothetical protein